MFRVAPALSQTIRQSSASVGRRSFATASESKGSSAPYFLGAGVALAAGAYYMTVYGDKDTKAAGEKSKAPMARLSSALSPQEFRNFKLEKIEPYNHNTSIFTFALPEGSDSGLTVASCLVTKSAKEGEGLGKNGKPAVRPYTPISSPDQKDKIVLMVKDYPNGVMSTAIHNLKVGEELAMKGPIPKFAYKANQFGEIAMIAGGTGITPMWQILQEIDANPEDKTKVQLIFSNISEKDILLREKLDDLAKRKPHQFKVTYVLDKAPWGWKGETGYITPEILKKYVPLSGFQDKIKILICGPPAQVESIAGAKKGMEQGPLIGMLADEGYVESQVFKF